MSDAQHAPTARPWRVEDGTTLIWGNCNPDDQSTRGMGYPIAECRTNPSGNWSTGPWADEAEANAAFIVHAVNCHDDLLEALEAVQHMNRMSITGSEDRKVWDRVRTAIARARNGGNNA